MDVRLINPVLETMINVLSTMANVQPDVGKPSLKKDEIAMGEVTGIMRMVSPQVRASLAITFTKPVIIDIVRRMLGEDIQEIDDTARDLTGEMANMVVGGAKNLFAAQGYEFDMSTPDILVGKDHTVHHQFSGKTILLPFTAESGQFFVEICFEDR
jgi:chemotaxis protein CheX